MTYLVQFKIQSWRENGLYRIEVKRPPTIEEIQNIEREMEKKMSSWYEPRCVTFEGCWEISETLTDIMANSPPYIESIRTVEELVHDLSPDGRVALWDRLAKGYCRGCGEKLDEYGRCRGCASGDEGLVLRKAGE